MAGPFAWLQRLVADPALDERWIVVDVESSGLNPTQDQLIAIGAVAMHRGRVLPADSFEVTLQQRTPSTTANILVHGVGVAAQKDGSAPRGALEGFEKYAARSPVLAFHAPFDRTLIERSSRQYLGRPFKARWIDLAGLATALFPKTRLKSLDEWLEHLQIPVTDRHTAAADALATAMLAARLCEAAARQGATQFRDLERLARSARWAG